MNNNAPQRYQEISLTDLFWKLCSSWRVLVVSMLVFAVLAGGYRVSKNISYNTAVENESRTRETAKQNGASDENQAYNLLTEEEAAAVDNAVVCARQYQMNLDYRKNSVYINLDPYNENVHILNYIITVNREETDSEGMGVQAIVEMLKQSYVGYINSGAAAGELSKAGGAMDEVAAGELITAETGDGFLDDTNALQTGSFTTSGGTTTFKTESDSRAKKACALFTVKVLGSSDEESKTLADELDKVLVKYADTLSASLDKHQIKLRDSNPSVVVDTELATKKQSFNTDLTNLKTNLDNTLAAFTDGQKSAYENILLSEKPEEDEQEKEEESASAPAGQTVSVTAGLVKYILFGLVIGLFLSAMVLTLVYVMVPTLKTTEDLTGCFHYYLMADMSAHREIRKRFGAGLDRMIRNLRYRGELSLEEEQRLLATNLKVTCRKAQISSVYLTSSCVLGKEEEQIVEKLIADLKKYNIMAAYGGSIERDAESYENMTNTGTVVYIEKLGKSRFGSLENIHAMTEKQGVKILGVVTV